MGVDPIWFPNDLFQQVMEMPRSKPETEVYQSSDAIRESNGPGCVLCGALIVRSTN